VQSASAGDACAGAQKESQNFAKTAAKAKQTVAAAAAVRANLHHRRRPFDLLHFDWGDGSFDAARGARLPIKRTQIIYLMRVGRLPPQESGMQERGRRVDGVLARKRRVRGGARALSEPWQRDFATRLLGLQLFVGGGRGARRGRGAGGGGRRGGGGRCCLAITGGGHGGGGGGQSYHLLLRRQTTKDGVRAAAASCLHRTAAGALPSPSHLHTNSASHRTHTLARSLALSLARTLSRAAARRSMPPSHPLDRSARSLPRSLRDTWREGARVGQQQSAAATWIVTLDRSKKCTN
jgi:hypothetical protein